MSMILNREQRAKALQPSVPSERAAASHPTPRQAAAAWASREVFSINFIRHETLPQRVRRALVYAGLSYLVIMMTVLVGLIGFSVFSRGQWQHLRVQLQGQMPSADVLTALKQNMQTLNARAAQDLSALNAMTTLQQQRFLVGGKLAALSKTLPPRTWMTDLSGARDHRTITVQAAYLIDPERPYELPTKRWIEALKADPHFSQGLKRLDVSASSRKRQGRSERFDFELIAEWQPTGRR